MYGPAFPLIRLFVELVDSIVSSVYEGLFHRRRRISPRDLWFWTEDWQIGEREADDDLKVGRYEDFKNIDQLITVLAQTYSFDNPSKVDRLAEMLRRTTRRIRRRRHRSNP